MMSIYFDVFIHKQKKASYSIVARLCTYILACVRACVCLCVCVFIYIYIKDGAPLLCQFLTVRGNHEEKLNIFKDFPISL